MRIGRTIGLWVLLAGCGTLRQEPAPEPYRLHGAGFADPSQPANHGAVLRASNYDLRPCQSCHGADLFGGESGVSCARCHAGGATACTTCHGAPPATGAHAVHAQRVPCASCHVVPAAYDSPGHIDGDGKAELVFGGLAIARGATPRFENGRCSGTYCHGATLAGGSNPAPSWTDGPGAVACGTCHAVPLSGHYGGASCHFCHGAVVDASRRILRPDLHPDGVVQAVDLSAECSACHGPPQDLGGAHAAHLAGANGRAVGCGECHRVPAEVAAPGHLDDTPGAEIAFGPLARTGRSAPAWDRAQQRCSGTYCHGATLRGGANRAPAWSGGPGEAPCGACHGVPMPNHYGERCSDCHGAVVDRGGRIVRPDLHVNGRIDFAEVP